MKLHLPDSSSNYLLAMSGGVDSMVLGEILLHHKVKFAVAHVNYKFRDYESDEDMMFVIRWCESHKIKYHIHEIDPHSIKGVAGINLQAESRRIRYSFFEELRRRYNYTYILTAHHADDSVETMYFNLIRGTGIEGLTGIQYRNKYIIRPMLYITKEEIIQYADEHSIAYREDSSNIKSDYSRNKLRNEVFPLIEELFPGFKKRQLSNLSIFNEINGIYKEYISQKIIQLIEKRNDADYLLLKKLTKEPFLDTLLYEVIKLYAFQASQLTEFKKLIVADSGKCIRNNQFVATRYKNFILFTNNTLAGSTFHTITAYPTEIYSDQGNISIERVSDISSVDYTTSDTLYISIEDISKPIIVRKAQQGDYMYPLGMNKKKKINRIWIDDKIAPHLRDTCWVLQQDELILALFPYRIDNRAKLTQSSKNIIKISKINSNNVH